MADRRMVTRGTRPTPRSRRAVGVVLLMAASVIGVAQWLVYDATPVAQGNRVRAVVVAVVLVVAGVRLVLTPALPHEVGVRSAMLAGGALVFFAVLGAHERLSAVAVEGFTGVVALFAAVAALPPVQPPGTSHRA
ncbi:MAG TPA: hypothetical protein PLZ93_03635 [Nocardioides sp.]|uniref:hypothetical protein n=1 Tax=uncultured Nocardioides sp. TaxID=198441 RepID=UPI000EE2716F|nr:hypothetical protein [uncultured Nocardioides sp.]HCB04110.1 hypothetical protein [Nocardioides sp.]HRD59426.1 hypothetical protein [Nocardioides sp.]HRI94684.1 hypothetical protein [Nocardioides sp.]